MSDNEKPVGGHPDGQEQASFEEPDYRLTGHEIKGLNVGASEIPADVSIVAPSLPNDEAALLQHIELFGARARADVHAERFFDRPNGRWAYKPVSRAFDANLLQSHMANGTALGAYLIRPGTNITRLAAFDLDDHDGTLGWQAMCAAAQRLYDTGRNFGLEASALRSGGGFGIQLHYRWDTDQDAASVRELLQTIIAAVGMAEGTKGVALGEVEIFPKQCEVAVGSFGSLLALPFGRKSVPLDAGMHPISTPESWVSSMPVPTAVPKAAFSPSIRVDAVAVEDALKHLPADDYGTWVKFGLALKHSLGEDGFEIWNRWSAQSAKYPGQVAARRQWDVSKPRPDGVKVGTIFHFAQQAGWQGSPLPRANLPVIEVRGGDLVEIVDTAAAALSAADTGIYQRSGELVRAIRLDKDTREGAPVKRKAGSTMLIPAREAWLVEQMSRHAEWVKIKIVHGKLKTIQIDPPPLYARTLLARQGEWPFPVLQGILRTPTIDQRGRVIQCPGYDEHSCLLLDFTAGEFPTVPERPTKADAQLALELYVGRAEQTPRGVLRGFPFVNEASKSVALSAFLAALARPMLGPIPLHAFDAPAAGTGKSKLVEMVGQLATGIKPAAMSQGKSPEEDEKRLATVLHAGDALIWIDNCVQPLEGDFLCSMLTQETVQARILGQSERRILPSAALVLATGNNLTMHGDISRRTVVCRLDAKQEKPEERKFDFDAQVDLMTDRPAFVVAALTALRAYALADDKPQLKPVGSFADWDLIRGTLVWCGYADPAESRNEVMATDSQKNELLEIMDLWQAAYSLGASTTVAKLGERGFGDPLHDALANVNGSGNKQLNGKSVGRWLKRNKDRIAGGRAFRQLEGRQWQLDKVED